ncbi:MAG: hypothetical protein JMN24_17545 [gamma proteobacterium endosymbiont of Lamellibrachia anaximandri]|nr:hypothetical protein [gamma proteobacterium endosymbiont of Lamellibrachia anaximandri]MBL3619590.1 hypothetical protein [gamma proteobacterium endosymbiont of Lamellibrachia anaximandri]
MVHIATVSNKQDLYKFSERYGRYLKEDLSYLPLQSGGSQHFALVYGNFATRSEAKTALYRLPRYLGGRQPSIESMQTIQRHISE